MGRRPQAQAQAQVQVQVQVQVQAQRDVARESDENELSHDRSGRSFARAARVDGERRVQWQGVGMRGGECAGGATP